jgi:hypothetical protein
MPDPDAGRPPEALARDFGAAARDAAARARGECGRKRRFPDQAAADRAVTYWRSQGDYSIHAYECPHGCGGWHIGHPPRGM